MLLPFAVLGRFSTASTTYGAAFYGFAAAILLIYLIYLKNKKSLLKIALVVSIWFPLVETSRWAWNPNLIMFWIALGLIFFEKKTSLSLLLAGIFLGLSIHHHYLSFIATAIFISYNLFIAKKNKNLNTYWTLAFGFIIPILPFVLFDLTHPPGLFITRFFLYSQQSINTSFLTFLLSFFKNIFLVLNHYVINSVFAIFLLFYLITLVIYDLKNEKKNLIYILIWLLQILVVTLIKDAYSHYFLPALVFFLIYLFLPRKSIKPDFLTLSTVVLLSGSLFSIVPLIMTQKYVAPAWKPNIRTIDQITSIVYQEISDENLSGVNLTVLGSPDPNRYGWKYRSLLEIKGLKILSKYEYFTNSYLFVISTHSEDELRKDPSPEMERFRREKLVKQWSIDDSEWLVYLFSF